MKSLVSTLCVGLLAMTVSAQGAAGINADTTDRIATLEQVVVSASRWEEDKREVSSRIVTLSQREISLYQPQTAADLLGNSGEVFIQKSQQGGGSPMIRGFATNRLLYSVDGVRMNSAIFRSGNLQNVINLDPFAVDRLEILFGPGSVMYGSDALGGVMHFSTLRPRLSGDEDPLVTGKAAVRTSTANKEQTAHFDIYAGWKKWALVTSFTTFDFGDLKMGRYGPEEYLRPFYVQRIGDTDLLVENDDPLIQRPSGYTQINFMQKVRFKPSEAWDLQYALHYSQTSDYARYDRHVRYRQGKPRYGEWSYGPQLWMMNHFSVNHHGENAMYDQATLNLAWQVFEESRIDRDINDPIRRARLEKVNALSANLDFNKSFGARRHLYYGLEAVLNDVDSRGIDKDIVNGIEMDGPTRYPQATWNSMAAYLNFKQRFSENFLAQAGLRYNFFGIDATFDTRFYPFPFTEAQMNNGALTGSLGILYTPSEKLSLSANLSTGFRSPNVDDMGKVFDSAPGIVVIPNPDLGAEYAWNGEIGIAVRPHRFIEFDVSGYYTYLNNALVRRDFTLNGLDSIIYDGELSRVQAIQNAAFITVYGVQAGLDICLPSGFGLSANVNVQIGEEEVDDGSTSALRHAAPFFGIVRLTYENHNLKLAIYTAFSEGRTYDQLPQEERTKTEIYAVDANGNPYLPSWATLNFKADYRFHKNFSISAGLENIADLRYRPYSSGIVAPGRNVILAATAYF